MFTLFGSPPICGDVIFYLKLEFNYSVDYFSVLWVLILSAFRIP